MQKVNFKRLNEHFEDRLDKLVFSVTQSELTNEKRLERLERCQNDALAFAKEYYPKIFDLPFNDAHRWLAGLEQGMYTISGFRYSGKSAFVYIGMVIRFLAQGNGGIANINARTMDISKVKTKQLSRLITKNNKLMYDFQIEAIQITAGYCIFKGLGGKNTFLIAGSYQTGLRNIVDDDFNRICISVSDDMYNKESVRSEIDNERVADFVDSEVSGQLESDGLSIFIGNSISEKCPIVLLKDAHPENHFSLPALDADGKSTWPEYRSAVEWIAFQKTRAWDVWLGEYMDKPAVKGDIMDPDWLRSVNINTLKFIVTIAACDPSRGSSPGACDKAFGVGGLTDKQELVIRDLYVRKEGYDPFFDYIHQSHQRFGWTTVLWENDFSQWDLAKPYYATWMARNKATLPITLFLAKELATAYRSAEKADRIMNLVHPFQTGMALFDSQLILTPDYERFKTQFLSYGKAKENLDSLDMLATLYIMIFRYIERGSFKPVKERKWLRKGRMFGR